MSEYFVFVDSNRESSHKCLENRDDCKFRLTVTDLEGGFIKEIIVPTYNNSKCGVSFFSPSHHYPLICFHNYWGQHFLCNPSTEWVMPITRLSPCALYRADNGFDMGFGYLPSTNEYKLVHLFYTKFVCSCTSPPCFEFEICCEVYSLSSLCGAAAADDAYAINESSNTSNPWRRINAKCPHPTYGPPVCVDGVLHWMLEEVDCMAISGIVDESCAAIVSFDLRSEEFTTMPSTAQWDEEITGAKEVRLAELRQNLVVFDNSIDVLMMGVSVVGVWMVKDYKLGTWEKLYSIDLSYIENIGNVLGCRDVSLRPIMHVGDDGNDQLIIDCTFESAGVHSVKNIFKRIVYYNISTKCFTTLEVDDKLSCAHTGTFQGTTVLGPALN